MSPETDLYFRQLALGEWGHSSTPGPEVTIAEHQRRIRRDRKDDESIDPETLRFDDSVLDDHTREATALLQVPPSRKETLKILKKRVRNKRN